MRDFSKIKKLVVKIGSSSLVHEDLSINEEMIDSLMKIFKRLKDEGIEIALVSSGAIALGMHELKLEKRPKNMSLKQACAAVGQAKLMEIYNKYAMRYDLICGQILLNHDDFQVRKRMLYLSDTLDEMFKNHIIPIINENDALAVEEIKVGDNDTLSSLIAPMIHADLLILFSDIDGLFNKNPKIYSDAYKIDEVSQITKEIINMAGVNTTEVGTGGMKTKINAAIISTNAGCNMLICNSNQILNLDKIINGENIGTLFKAKKKGISSREHWMIFKANSLGEIIVDDGCKNALLDKKVSILAKGIVKVNGSFLANTVIDIKDLNNNVIAKGICNYSSIEIDEIKGLSTDIIKEKLIDFKKKEVVHANDLVIMREDFIC